MKTLFAILLSLSCIHLSAQNDLEITYGKTQVYPDSVHLALHYGEIPLAHASNLYTGALVTNIGGVNETNVTVSITVTQIGGGVINSYTSPAASLTAGDSLEAVSSAFSITATGMYEIAYSVTYANAAMDASPANNTYTDTLSVTDEIFSRHNCRHTGLVGHNNNNPYRAISLYQPVANDTLHCVKVALAAPTATGATIAAIVYEFDLATGSFIQIYDGTGTACEHTIQPFEINMAPSTTPIKTCLCVDSLPLIAHTQYLIGYVSLSSDTVSVAMDSSVRYNPPLYLPTQYFMDGLTGTWFYMDYPFLISAGMGTNICSICPTPPTGIGVPDSPETTIYPNPANDRVHIQSEAPLMRVDVADLNGRLVRSIPGNYAYNVMLNVYDLEPAAYQLILHHEDDARTVKPLVVR